MIHPSTFCIAVLERFCSAERTAWHSAAALAVFAGSGMCAPAGASTEDVVQAAVVPAEVAGLYRGEMEPDVSDGFDRIDPEKWTTRARKARPDGAAGKIKAEHNQVLEEDGTRYLSLLANQTGEAGVSALHRHQYGFTVCRWRLRGIERGKRHAAHPAVWSFSYNMGAEPRNAPNPNGKTLEIDWMEYIKWQEVPGYHARILPSDGGGSDTERSVYMIQSQTDFHGWRIHGYEYTPEYVQLWEHVDGRWRKKGVELRFGDETDVEGKVMDRAYRSGQYFVLSNIWFHNPEYELTPVRLDIDYLHHYPMK